jgi:hypothetical protein
MLGDRSKQQPIAALAIATTCWPIATFTLCCIAPSILATDAVIQWGKGTPIGMKGEQTAAEALSMLYFEVLLCFCVCFLCQN